MSLINFDRGGLDNRRTRLGTGTITAIIGQQYLAKQIEPDAANVHATAKKVAEKYLALV